MGGNPLLITTDTSIHEGSAAELEEQMQEREGYGCKRLNENVYPQYAMLP